MNPERIDAVVADSFEGIKANASITEQIRVGRSYAKQNEGFCSMLKMMHGDDWEKIFDADATPAMLDAYIRASWFDNFEKLPNPRVVQLLGATARCLKMQLDALRLSVEYAARNSSSTACGYAIKVMQRWHSAGAHSESEVIDLELNGTWL